MPNARLLELMRRYGTVVLTGLVVTTLHYLTPHAGIHDHTAHTEIAPWWVNLHGFYRRLYYFPIILSAFRGGPRAGVVAALLVIAVYLPHATGRIGHDPGTLVEKIGEMALYLGVGLLTGVLVGRINSARTRLQNTAQELRSALDEKTAMEAELIRSARLAAVGRLSAGLAHEIRNPLASIQGSAEILGDDFPADHPKGGLFRILLAETARLNGVLSRFLAFARNEPGQSAPFDLAVEAQAVAQLASLQSDAPPVRISGLGQLPTWGNPEQIRQVLLNLVLNAAAAASSDGQVDIVLESAGGRAVCRVIDSGPGFSAEAIRNFGTPFFSTREGGTGLGLATSLRIAEDLGGSLTIDLNHRPGSCVVLALPMPETI